MGRLTRQTAANTSGLWYSNPLRVGKGKRFRGAGQQLIAAIRTFDGKQTVLSSNNSNFVKGAEGEPTADFMD